MKIFNFLVPALTLLAMVETVHAAAPTEITAKKTNFAQETVIQNGANSYAVQITGQAKRTKHNIKVYTVAHYLQNPVRGHLDAVLSQVFSDSRAKQLTFNWKRNVEKAKVQDSFLEAFRQVLSSTTFTNLQNDIQEFLSFYDQNVSANDVHLLQWVPGGVVVLIINGVEKGSIENVDFAEALWSIWFSSDVVVNRKHLLKLILE
jgi:Chalcone isomerase-like